MWAKSAGQSRGFTLIEIAAVVFLLALVMSALIPSIAKRSDQAERARLIAELIDLDARARLLAQRHDDCFIRFQESGSVIVLTVVEENTSTILQRVDIPARITLSFSTGVNAAAFDHAGHTAGYSYSFKDVSVSTTIRLNGLTGWHELAVVENDR
jgi:prepilin-type N-terminal cleavage/methylation domain-containing protein